MTNAPPPISAAQLVGMTLRHRREELHLSQVDVADLARTAGLNWSQETVARVETGRRDVSAGELVALGLALRMRPGDLLDGGAERVRLGKSESWVPGRVVQLWADGDRAPDYGYATYVDWYRDDGIAELDSSTIARAELTRDEPAEARLEVAAALHQWAADEASAGREVDQRRWKGKEAQLWQEHRKGNR